MSQRMRNLLLSSAPVVNGFSQYYSTNYKDKSAQKAFHISFYVLLCFIIASILWLVFCYLLYRVLRGCNLNSNPTHLDNYDALESDSSDSGEYPERPTRWQRLLGFTKRKAGASTHSLQLIHVPLAPRTQSMPVLVNLNGSSLFLQHKSPSRQ